VEFRLAPFDKKLEEFVRYLVSLHRMMSVQSQFSYELQPLDLQTLQFIMFERKSPFSNLTDDGDGTFEQPKTVISAMITALVSPKDATNWEELKKKKTEEERDAVEVDPLRKVQCGFIDNFFREILGEDKKKGYSEKKKGILSLLEIVAYALPPYVCRPLLLTAQTAPRD
jgi:hypothetical protein